MENGACLCLLCPFALWARYEYSLMMDFSLTSTLVTVAFSLKVFERDM